MPNGRLDMAMGRIRPRMLLFLVVLLAAGVVLVQYLDYRQLCNELQQGNAKSRLRLNQIVTTLPRQETFRAELTELSSRYGMLRQQLPAEPRLEAFQRDLEGMLREQGLEIQAQRMARYSRSFYREIRLAYSIKGSMEKVQQVFARLNAQPRLVRSGGPEKESFENTGLTLSIFSVPPKEVESTIDLECLAAPQGIWLPLLAGKLAQLYDNYLRTCRAVMENGPLYQDIQRYRYLKEEVLFLEHIRDSITAAS